MKTFFITVLTLFATTMSFTANARFTGFAGHHQNVYTGIDAQQVCGSFYFYEEVHQQECYYTLNQARYLNADVTDVCRRMYKDGYKLPCLAAIVNKEYTSQELRYCRTQYTSEDKLTCLQKTGSYVLTHNGQTGHGHTGNGESTPQKAQHLALDVKKLIKQGHVLQALVLLDELIELLSY